MEFVHLMGTIGVARPSSHGTLLPSFIYAFFHVPTHLPAVHMAPIGRRVFPLF